MSGVAAINLVAQLAIDWDAFFRGCPKAVATFNAARQQFGLRPLSRKELGFRPHSGRWRRPKLWRARDILEHRQVQGRGFRGEVRSATVARREFAVRVRREEDQRRAANAKLLDTWRTAWQIWQRMEERRERERVLVVGRPEAFEKPAPKGSGVIIKRSEVESLKFPGGPDSYLQERFFASLGYAESYPLEEVIRVLDEFWGLEFEFGVCTSCGGPNPRFMTVKGSPLFSFRSCDGCAFHGKPRSTLPAWLRRHGQAQRIRERATQLGRKQ